MDVGSHVADDVITECPVLSLSSRPCVAAAVKDEILKGSSWAGKAAENEDEENESGSGSDGASSESTHGKKKESGKRKRGRALVRLPTDEGKVPLFAHPMHPDLAREFVTSLEATWAIFGTPESGCGLLGCLSPLAKVPVVAFARNSSHAQALAELVKTSIREKVLKMKGEWTSRALSQQWAKLNEVLDSSSGDSSADSSDDDQEPGSKEEGGQTPTKSEKKDKKDGTDKKDSKKNKKKDTEEKPSKKEKKKDKDATDTKHNKKKDTTEKN